jgi:hypothetical protein
VCESCGRGVLSRMSADVGSFVGLGDSSGGGSGPLAPSPFRLPAAYEEAKERKVSAVSDLRNAVKAVRDPLIPLVTGFRCCLSTSTGPAGHRGSGNTLY